MACWDSDPAANKVLSILYLVVPTHRELDIGIGRQGSDKFNTNIKIL